MDGIINNNIVELCGIAAAEPIFSHKSKEREFYTLPLIVCRLSGAEDIVNVTVDRRMAQLCRGGERLRVCGELRSFNNRSGTGSRLVISVFAREVSPSGFMDENRVELTGTLCKKPTYRRTPMGREICDLMLAVNRRYGRSDYLPCIAWGIGASEAREWEVGQKISLAGRLQSRKYIKQEEGVSVEKTAFEVSVTEFR
ncbi:MAG: single-stranded DNA-binding protein [Oscillospiraceae bacterium]|nr:single-stranded DNA-binding protein [Oscillospiraceae bacterium]